MHQLKNQPTKRYGIACNPLSDTYHMFELETTQTLSTGQPVVVYADTKEEAYDQLFSEYTLDADGNLDTYTARATTLSIDYTEADADQTAADAMEIIDGLLTRPIKHPDRDEWAMVVSQQVLGRAKAGAKRDALLAKHVGKVSNGKNKSKDQAKLDNWHKAK